MAYIHQIFQNNWDIFVLPITDEKSTGSLACTQEAQHKCIEITINYNLKKTTNNNNYNPKNQLLQIDPLPLWDVRGSIPLLDLP